MTAPRFVISMLALDGLEMSKACITSVLSGSHTVPFKLVLTNNASKDGTKEFFDEVAATFGDVVVIHNEENEIFIGPNNRVFEMAREWGAEFMVTLNNDVVVPPGWLEKIEAVFRKFPNAAVVGPKGTTSQLNAQMLGDSSARLEFVEGSLMACRIKYVETQGPLFSSYLKWIFHDDSDLSLRMQRAGYTIHQADFHVQHRNGSTCTRHPDAIRRCRDANLANQRTMLSKWAHWNRVRRFDFPIVVKRRFASGDILLMTPIIRALHELWPLCPIDVECGVPEIFKGNPLVRRAATAIGVHPHAMVIDLNNSYERTPQRHVLESYAERAGVEASKVVAKLELFAPRAEVSKERTVAVHVGPTTWPGRNWPMDRWQHLISLLKLDGWTVLLFGSKGREVFKVDADYRGQAGVHELATLISGCELFIGLDSFLMHVAQAMGTPTIALCGITNPACFMTAGTGRDIAVCSDPAHPDTGRRNKVPNVTFLNTDDSVMRTIQVDQVMAAVAEITKKEEVAL